MLNLVTCSLLYCFLSNLFVLHSAAYTFDKSCANYQSMINDAYQESIRMMTLGRDSIQGEVWLAPGSVLGDTIGQLFPTFLTADEKTQIQSRLFDQANLPPTAPILNDNSTDTFATVLTAQATSNSLWFMCEPLSYQLANTNAGGGPINQFILLEDLHNPNTLPEIVDITGGSNERSTSTQVCKDEAAGCTLIGDNVQVIVFTQKALTRGSSNFGPGSQATVKGFHGLLKTGVIMDQLTQASLLSFYMTHELFHTLSTPQNMALAGMFSNSSFVMTLLTLGI
jgi:hypothetical protein